MRNVLGLKLALVLGIGGCISANPPDAPSITDGGATGGTVGDATAAGGGAAGGAGGGSTGGIIVQSDAGVILQNDGSLGGKPGTGGTSTPDAAVATGGTLPPDAAAATGGTRVPDAAVGTAGTEVPADAALPTPDAAPPELPLFSFFVTSLVAMRELSGSPDGFGGDLRFGETGPGAGLRGADAICAAVAERSMPGASVKQWRAFLSVTADENGQLVNAIDRIGNGPWYDRTGRLFANNRADALHTRPVGDPTIINDLPNEDGIPNHAPDPGQGQVDNHDVLTGTNNQGGLYSRTGTCLDWTSARGNRNLEGQPRCGHSWIRRAGGPGGGMQEGWMSTLDESGCAAGVSIIEMGPPNLAVPTVGSGGGYGAIFCFALTP